MFAFLWAEAAEVALQCKLTGLKPEAFHGYLMLPKARLTCSCQSLSLLNSLKNSNTLIDVAWFCSEVPDPRHFAACQGPIMDNMKDFEATTSNPPHS